MVEEVDDHWIWQIATFHAQRGERFAEWWRAQALAMRKRRLALLDVPTFISNLLIDQLPDVAAHFGDASPLLTTSGRGVPIPALTLGQVPTEGLGGLIGILIEEYMKETGDEVVQMLRPVDELPIDSPTSLLDAKLDLLQRKHQVSEEAVQTILRMDSNLRPRDDVHDQGDVDYTQQLYQNLKLVSSRIWMDAAEGKHLDACRSPSFALKLGCRRTAAAAVAVIQAIWRAHGPALAGEALVDVTTCFGIIGDVVASMDTNVLPARSCSEEVVKAFEAMELERVPANSSVYRAATSNQIGLAYGTMMIQLQPNMALEPFDNVVQGLTDSIEKGRWPIDGMRHAHLMLAMAHVGRSSCFILTGDLKNCEKALSAAIDSAPPGSAWEPHEDADWRSRRAQLRQRMRLDRRDVFADFERVIAGMTPDDEEYIIAAFHLAYELSKPDGVCGTAERGERYLLLGEAALRRSIWLFNTDARFAEGRTAKCGAIRAARDAYSALGPVGSAQRRAAMHALVAMQRSGTVVEESLERMTVRRCCSYCGQEDAAVGTRLQKCAACNTAFYCNREHQKLHWRTHKVICTNIRG